jgi:hypothetical protein
VLQRHNDWDLAESYLQYKYRAREAEARLENLEVENSHYQTQNDDLKHKIQVQDSDVRKAQDAAFAVVASTGPKAEDDDVIRSKLKSVTSQWKPFAKKWALKSFDELQGDRLEAAKPILEELVAPDEAESADGLFERNANKAPGILLNAELARFVVRRLLENPFIAAFQPGVTDDTEALKPNTAQTLHAIYDYLKQGAPRVCFQN